MIGGRLRYGSRPTVNHESFWPGREPEGPVELAFQSLEQTIVGQRHKLDPCEASRTYVRGGYPQEMPSATLFYITIYLVIGPPND